MITRAGGATGFAAAAVLVHRTIQLIQLDAPAFPAKAGIHFCRRHRLSPV
jgi:hypothetical protein